MKTIEITDEKYEEIKAQLGEDFKDINSYEDLIGEKMFFRTVTYHALGEVKKIVGRFVYLKNASWVADTGRFSDFIGKGLQTNTEIEYIKEMFLNLDTVVDIIRWTHKLPTETK